MKYTKYFSLVNEQHGLQRLNTKELARLFNIVHIEGRIKECDALLEESKLRNDGPLRYSKMQRLSILKSLTHNKLPSELIKDMYTYSQNS